MIRICPAALKTRFDALNLSPQSDPTDALIKVAESCVGVGNTDPVVDLFRSAVSEPTGQAWCLDFQQACVAYVELLTGKKSNLPPAQSVLDLWHLIRGEFPPDPVAGCIVLWELGQTWEGHCGLITGVDPLNYMTVEGNTSAPDTVMVRQGDGIYNKVRPKAGMGSFRTLGYFKVFS